MVSWANGRVAVGSFSLRMLGKTYVWVGRFKQGGILGTKFEDIKSSCSWKYLKKFKKNFK